MERPRSLCLSANTKLSDRLQKLRKSDCEVALVLDLYDELERVYQGALEAMGASDRHVTETMNSDEVTLSFTTAKSQFSSARNRTNQPVAALSGGSTRI